MAEGTHEEPTGAVAVPRTDLRRDVAEAADLVRRATQTLAGHALTAEAGGGGPADLLALVPEVEALARGVEGLRARLLPRAEAEGLWELDGRRSFAAWQQGEAGIPYGRAARDSRRARALRDQIPAFAHALEAGEVGVEKIDVLRTAMDRSPARAESLRADGGASLAAIARETTDREWRTVVGAWAATVDPEAEERAHRESAARREVFVSPTLGGYHLSGWLDVEGGQVVRAALDAVAATLESRDEAEPTGRRPRAQVMADALVGIAGTVLGGGVRDGSRIKPHVTISVPFDTARRVVEEAAAGARASWREARRRGVAARLDVPGHADTSRTPSSATTPPSKPRAPGLDVLEAVIGASADPAALAGMAPATYADGAIVPPSVLAAHLCDGAYARVVFGPAGEPLDVGREERLFTRGQVRALRERDGGCRFPGCGAPVDWCEAHHTTPWSAGGHTDLDTAVLLCGTHHHELHRLGWSVHRYPDRWEFLDRHGEVRGTRARRGTSRPRAAAPPPARVES